MCSNSSWDYFYWAINMKNNELEGEFPDNFIHEMRLPWPNNLNHEYKIDDICFLHFARVNYKRQKNKERF